MALPTIHWHRFAGTLVAGGTAAIPHTIRDGQYPNGAALHAVHFDMSSGTYTEPPNVQIGEYQARTTQNFYLSNYDGQATHYFGVIARRYHSIEGQNL